MLFKNKTVPAAIFAVICLLGCVSTGAISDIQGKEWILEEFSVGGKTTRINRSNDFGLGEIYSINFEEGRVSGVGAPNRFFGPYIAGSGSLLTMGPMGATQMASFIEPEELKEHEYFAYLNAVYRWGLRGGKLELYTKNTDGSEVVLVFAEK